MADRLYAGTRKGLFAFARGPAGWKLDKVHFLGEPATLVLPHPVRRLPVRHAHAGPLWREASQARPGQEAWEELEVPVFPAGTEVNDGPPIGDAPPKRKAASLDEIWALEAGGADEPGVLWAGTIPGGLFRSSDSGRGWQLVETLWNREERWRWFGGGKDDPGIHSISVDPRDSRQGNARHLLRRRVADR